MYVCMYVRMYVGVYVCVCVCVRLEPIMLKNLPIIPSQTSQKNLFLIYSQIIAYYYYSFNFTGSITKCIQKL